MFQYKRDYYERESAWLRRTAAEALAAAFADSPSALDTRAAPEPAADAGGDAEAALSAGWGGGAGGGGGGHSFSV